MPFEIINQHEYYVVKLQGVCNGDEVPALSIVFNEVFAKVPLKFVIFQCNDCGFIGQGFLRQMGQIYRDMKHKNGQVRLVGASNEFMNSVRSNGVDRIFINKMSIRGALVDFGLVKSKEIDVNFVNPFLSATMKVFKIQCFLELKPQRPALKKPTDPLLMGDLSGIISITSETFTGTLAISMSDLIFMKIATNMLGEPVTSVTEQNIDLIGELANMILGQAKLELNSLGFKIEMALPSCVWGKDHKVKHFGGGVCVMLPFQTELGIVHCEIMTNNNMVQGEAKVVGSGESKKAA